MQLNKEVNNIYGSFYVKAGFKLSFGYFCRLKKKFYFILEQI